MEVRLLRAVGGRVDEIAELPAEVVEGWVWVDAEVDDDDLDGLRSLADHLNLDPLAVTDAIRDLDLPKLDDFGHNLLLVLHGLREDRVETYEIDCFLTAGMLITVHTEASPAVRTLWDAVRARPELAAGGPDELAARLADVLTRRLLTVVEAFDERVDEMVAQALAADPDLVAHVTAVRADLSTVRRVVQPQREALDLVRSTPSTLVGDPARRRFSDVFDVASRAASGLDAARTALAETLDAYRGAEARLATDVTKVLTVYAAVMLPLSLVAGFFGMNHPNLPGIDRDWGWVVVAAAMVVVAAVSLGVFVSLGWIRRPSGRTAGATLGRGLVEASRAPVQLAGAVYEISTMPLRTVVGHHGRSSNDQSDTTG